MVSLATHSQETDGYVCVFQVCYHVLGLVHAMWPPLPQTVRCILLLLFHVLRIGTGKRTMMLCLRPLLFSLS